MAHFGIVFGLLLCSLTVAGLFVSPIKSPTQFVPLMLGIPLLFSGVVALNPHRRKLAMHAAAGLALVGALLAGGRAVVSTVQWAGGDHVNELAFSMVWLMTLLCVLFVGLCIGSFVRARRRREKAEQNVRLSGRGQRQATGGAESPLEHSANTTSAAAEETEREKLERKVG